MYQGHFEEEIVRYVGNNIHCLRKVIASALTDKVDIAMTSRLLEAKRKAHEAANDLQKLIDNKDEIPPEYEINLQILLKRVERWNTHMKFINYIAAGLNRYEKDLELIRKEQDELEAYFCPKPVEDQPSVVASGITVSKDDNGEFTAKEMPEELLEQLNKVFEAFKAAKTV